MNKQQFEKLQESLIKRGYWRYTQHWQHEDYGLGKGFHRNENQWEDDRSAYQILMSVYDYTLHPEWHNRMTQEERYHVGMEVIVGVSRTIDERIEMSFTWHDDTTIEEVEQKAESFYEWVCKEYPEPRKE